MDEDRQVISISQAERAAIFQGGRALCLILAAVVVTAEIMIGPGLPDRSHGLMLAGIILLVGYAMSSWHADRSLIRARHERVRAEAAVRILLADIALQLVEILGEVRTTREQGEERTAEMRLIEERVTKLVEVDIARLAELAKAVTLHGKAVAVLHDDIDELKAKVADADTKALAEVVRVLAETRHMVGQLAHRVERAEAVVERGVRHSESVEAEVDRRLAAAAAGTFDPATVDNIRSINRQLSE